MQDLISNPEPTIKRPSGHVYVLLSKKGLIKVGSSRSNPEGRIQAHNATLSISEDEVSEKWISSRHQKYKYNEQKLIRSLVSYAYAGREWFKGVEFSEVLRKANSLIDYSKIPVTRLDVESSKEQERRWREMMPSGLLMRPEEIEDRAEMRAAYSISDMLINYLSMLLVLDDRSSGHARTQLALHVHGMDVVGRSELMGRCFEIVEADDVDGFFSILDEARNTTMDMIKKELPGSYDRLQDAISSQL